MDMRVLRQFVNLAESLHFGRAAEASHISVSALSRNIRQLEDEAGATLFERSNRSVALTRSGGLFLEYAREALAQWESIRNTVMESEGELRGEFSLYCSVTASYSFLFDILSQFRRDHPAIEIKLHTGDPDLAIQRVLAGDEDIAIGARPDRLASELAFKSIAVSPLVFIAARSRRDYARLAKAPARDWASVPMVLSETGLARRRVDRWFRKRGVQPTIYAQVAGNEAIVSMVSLGFGIGVVPRIVLDNSPLARKVSMLDISPALAPYEVGLFVLERRLRNPVINAFWSQLK